MKQRRLPQSRVHFHHWMALALTAITFAVLLHFYAVKILAAPSIYAGLGYEQDLGPPPFPRLLVLQVWPVCLAVLTIVLTWLVLSFTVLKPAVSTVGSALLFAGLFRLVLLHEACLLLGF